MGEEEEISSQQNEKEKDDNEFEKQKQISWHSIYKLHNKKGMTENILTLLSSNMVAEEETRLRNYLSQSKIFAGDSSQIASVDKEIILQNQPVQLFTKILSNSSKSTDSDEVETFLICFLVDEDGGFELFQKDLDRYCYKLVPHLLTYMEESTDITTYLELLESWYDQTLCFIYRCLVTFDESFLAGLVCASFSGNPVNFNASLNSDFKNDLERFVECCSLSDLFSEISAVPGSPTSSMPDLAFLHNTQHIMVNQTDDENFQLQPKGYVTKFCQDCIRSLKTVEKHHPLKMRQMLENYKLKCIQDMNSFKRLIRQAEFDHYMLYRAYQFLLSCDNGEVIMKISSLQNSIENNIETKRVLDVLNTFITKLGGFSELTTKT